MWLAVLAFLVLIPATFLAAQQSRTGEIEAARKEKARQLKPDQPSKAERRLRSLKEEKTLERFSAGIAGFRLKLGGLVQGGGFAAGPEYLRQDLANGNLIFRSAAQASIKAYQRYDLQLTAPHFARNQLFFDFFAVHHDYPGINYYGPGPRSEKGARSNFRIIDNAIDGAFGWQPVRGFKLGASGGYLATTLGTGKDTRYVSTEQVFGPTQAIGIDTRPDFVRVGGFIRYDYRDNPGGPRSGGDYLIQLDRFYARPDTGNDFRRLNVELQQYIPFFNKRRVIALHARSVLTYPDNNDAVPFYLQPVLGGADDLRGFRPFRFYDNNMIVVNGEYRYEVFSGLDMALFADGGKVFHSHSQWNLHHMEGAFGFGFRFNVRNNVFMRIDTGFSHEGFQIWMKFGNIFGEERIRSSSFQ